MCSAFTNMPSLGLTIPGDANYDGKVDINDLTVVFAHYNQSGLGWGQGEFTGSGTVDINDLTIVLAHYNQSVGASAAAEAVPEPGALALLTLGLTGLLAWIARSGAHRQAANCRAGFQPAGKWDRLRNRNRLPLSVLAA